jgi:hypothetical protein
MAQPLHLRAYYRNDNAASPAAPYGEEWRFPYRAGHRRYMQETRSATLSYQ